MLTAKVELREFTERLLQTRIPPGQRKKRQSHMAKELLRQNAEAPTGAADRNEPSASAEKDFSDYIVSWLADQELSRYEVEHRPMQKSEHEE